MNYEKKSKVRMRCIVPGCDVDSKCPTTSKGVTFFKFPLEPTLSETWLKSIQRNGLDLSEDSAVCSKHFQKDDIRLSTNKHWSLRAGAVPVICLPVCRICFATDCKLNSMIKHNYLGKGYETLTGISVENSANLPSYLCTECSHRLINCIKFRTRSIQANSILQDIFQDSECLTLEVIKSNKYLLSSTLSLTLKNHYDLEIEHEEKDNIGQDKQLNNFTEYDVNVVKVERDDTPNEENLEEQETTNFHYPLKLHEVIVPGIKLEKDDCEINYEDTNKKEIPIVHDTMGIKVKVETIDTPDQGCVDDDHKHVGDRPKGEHHLSYNGFKAQIMQLKTQSRLKIHAKTKSLKKTGKIYSCDVCSKVFNKKYNLVAHFRIHTGERPFSCDICKQEFGIKHDLVNHMRKHSGEKPYSCDLCKKTFSLRNVLQAHMRTHTGEKPFVCKVCDKAFSQRANLSAHIKTHSGEKPYSCDVCKKRFSQRCNLITHSRIHSGEKPYSCNLCMISFSRNYHLQGHLKKHSGEKPYPCDVCKKAFTSRGNLRKHMTAHSGDKPYSCNLCNKAFNRKGNLSTHMKIHSDEKPFLCEICNKSFRRKDQLKIHSKKVHFSGHPLDFVNVTIQTTDSMDSEGSQSA